MNWDTDSIITPEAELPEGVSVTPEEKKTFLYFDIWIKEIIKIMSGYACPYGIVIDENTTGPVVGLKNLEGLLIKKTLLFSFVNNISKRFIYMALLLLQFTFEFVCFMEYGNEVLWGKDWEKLSEKEKDKKEGTTGMQINISPASFMPLAKSSNGEHFLMRGVSIFSFVIYTILFIISFIYLFFFPFFI